MSRVNSSAAHARRIGRSAVLAAWMMLLAAFGHAQAGGHGDLDVTAYNIAVAIDPAMQNLTATAKVAFTLKSPYATSGEQPQHDPFKQETLLIDWAKKIAKS